jgi:hypothetical protein
VDLGLAAADDRGVRAGRGVTRCQILARGNSYRAPGQCEKVDNLQRVKVSGRAVRICVHHAAVLERGGKIEVSEGER